MPMQTPGLAFQLPRQGTYSGYEMDGTSVVNADLKPGSILQLAGTVPTGVTGTVGNLYSRPAEGYTTPIGVVSEDWDKANQDNVNTQDGITANLRRGGSIPLAAGGYVKALVKHGTALVAGVTLLCPTDDTFHLTPWIGGLLSGGLVAASTAVTNSVSTEQTFTGASVTIPANSLRVGDVLRGTVQGLCSATALNDTLTVKVKLGSNILAITGAPDVSTGDKFVIHWALKVRTITASGTAVCEALTWNGTEAAAASAADIPSGSALASFTIDCTAANAITCTGTWSATSATCTANLEIFDIALDRIQTSLGARPVAVAMETTTINDSTNGQALAKVALLGALV